MANLLSPLLTPTLTLIWAALPAAAQSVSIDCLVRTPEGAPLVGAALCVGIPEAFDQSCLAPDSDAVVARSDAAGRLTASLPATSDGVHLYAWISAPGRAGRWLPWSRGDGQPRRHRSPVTLVPGVEIRGLILDADGKPVAGAQIRARDVLVAPLLRRYQRALMPSHSATFARSDARGRFTLAGALPLGMSVTGHAEGHYRASEGFANAHRPLVLRLRRGGAVGGRVLDAAGNAVDAWVQVRHVGGVAPLARTRTDARGSYRCNLEFAGRYQVVATPVAGGLPPGAVTGPVLAEPKLGVDLRIPKPEADDLVSLKIVDAATQKALAGGRAEIRWRELNPAALDKARWAKNGQRCRPAGAGGTVLLSGPGPDADADAEGGRVFVAVPGYAPRCVPGVQVGTEVVVALQPASAIHGLVVDAAGQPVAGARVVALGLQRIPGMAPFELSMWNRGRFPGYVVSGADGRFRLDGLPAGSFELHAQHPDHADGRVRRIDVEVGKTDSARVVLKKGVRWSGRLRGTGGRLGLSLVLARDNRGLRGQVVASLFRDGEARGEAVARLDAQGRFAFSSLQPGRYSVSLRTAGTGSLPVPNLRPLRVVRIESDDSDVRFDLSEDVPGVIAGKVDFAGSVLPPGRLAVVATEHTIGSVLLAGIDPLQALGPRSAITPQRGFRLEVPPGRYHCGLVDLQTGMFLYQTEKPIEVLGGLTETWISRPDLTPVRLTWDVKEDPVTRLQVRLPGGNGLLSLLGADAPDIGQGVRLQPEQTELMLFLPTGREVEIFLRNEEHLLTGDEPTSAPPVGRVVVTPARGKLIRAHIQRD